MIDDVAAKAGPWAQLRAKVIVIISQLFNRHDNHPILVQYFCPKNENELVLILKKMKSELPKTFSGFFFTKGQIMSECIYEIIDFPKYYQKNLIDFCPRRF